MSIFDLFLAAKDEYRRWRDGPPVSQPMQRQSRLQPLTPPASPPSPAPSAAPAPTTPQPSSDLPAVKSWSHPFGSKADPIRQLTDLAKAQAGYFPLGRNGLWHGGVHFDSGTAGTVGLEGQSHVRCLADGEVIAYRIPETTPMTTFHPAPKVTKDKPFASGFVLVRHRLEAPKIEGKGTPPSLIFYSLYMHLADWKSYQADSRRERPAFWPESNQRRVKQSAKDRRKGHPSELGAQLLHAASHGKAIGFLPVGAAVTVSGDGAYRKVESIKGPIDLQKADGSLEGYVGFNSLLDIGGGKYRVNTQRDVLNVRATPSTSGTVLLKLPKGTELTISGEGEFRKLESVIQYVRFDSLESERVPELGKVVVLDRPIPIQAGHLIGHLGPYQDCRDENPQEKLHLEVFACESVETFFKNSREWAKDLPEKERTWLKLEKGTKAVFHQESYSAATPPSLNHAHSLSGAPLLLPRSMLDGLATERKIKILASDSATTKNWYRLQNLLIDTDGELMPDVWVCDEVGKTPWVSPWSWEGYEVIYNNDPPQNALSYFLMNLKDYFDEKELDQWRPLADASDKGPVRARLFDIIDANKNGIITAEEVQRALATPSHAQSISRLVIHYESEWYYRERKWDALDKVLGHTGSTPILNWAAEKTRIKELSWWNEIEGNGALPRNGAIYHIHPLVFSEIFTQKYWFDISDFVAEYKKRHPSVFGFYDRGKKISIPELNVDSENALIGLLTEMKAQYYSHFDEYNKKYIAYMLSTIRIESYQYKSRLFFKPISEDISYSLAEINYGSGPTAVDRVRAIKNHNSSEGDGYKYRGRGLVQLTWKINYEKFSRLTGVDITSNPELSCDISTAIKIMMIGMRDGGFRTGHTLEKYLGGNGKDYYNARLIINGYHNGIPDKANEFEDYARLFEKLLDEI